MKSDTPGQWEVLEDRNAPGDWRVERIAHGDDGTVDVVIFSGPRAETLAREYFAWKERERRADTSPLRLVR